MVDTSFHDNRPSDTSPHDMGYHKDLIAALAEGATVITANQRQMADLGRAFAAWRISLGERVWDSPRIATFDVWLRELWEADAAEVRQLLSPQQQQVMWEQIIDSDAAAGAANQLQTPRIAALAADAWQMIWAWQLPWPLPATLADGDVATFVRWTEAFDRQCHALQVVDPARLIGELPAQLTARQRALPGQLLITGFEELSPAQQRLLDAVMAQGTDVRIVPLPVVQRTDIPLLACRDARAEMAAAADWARGHLQRKPDQRIGIVVPELSQLRNRLIPIFDEHLQAGHSLPGAQARSSLFNLSLGEPLAGQPTVRCALLCLELGLRQRLPVARLGELLHSPYVAGGENEAAMRALLDARLRRDGDPEVRLAWLRIRASDEEGGHHCPRLLDALAGLERVTGGARASLTAVRCVELFWKALKAMGWGSGARGARALVSDEFQALEAFREVMTQLAGLDRVLPPQPADTWLKRLRALLQKRVFQPRSPQAPVQVMGLMEAAGLAFDRLWVMGLDDETLPAAARPNPLLPLALQRDRALPHATPSRELNYARGLLGHLAACADEVVFSYSRRVEDREKSASPLVAGLKEAEAAAIPVYPWREAMLRSARLHVLSVDPAPGLQADESISGGTGLLAAQAQCPFKAFACYRLTSNGLDQPDVGLDPGERGTLTHRVLELVWAELETRTALAALDETDRQACVERHARACLQAEREHRSGRFPQRFMELEVARLTRLIDEWLLLELTRGDFTVIEREGEREVSIAGLPLTLRVDRVDRLADDRLAIFDYKTGGSAAPSVNTWIGERPDEPQLPIYAVYGGAPVDALGFGWVKPGQSKLVGLASDESLAKLHGLKVFNKPAELKALDDWVGLIDGWRDELDGLSRAFQAGIATVSPKTAASCGRCDQASLCRVSELLQRLDDEDAGEGLS